MGDGRWMQRNDKIKNTFWERDERIQGKGMTSGYTVYYMLIIILKKMIAAEKLVSNLHAYLVRKY